MHGTVYYCLIELIEESTAMHCVLVLLALSVFIWIKTMLHFDAVIEITL